jgi:hypothetical protein
MYQEDHMDVLTCITVKAISERIAWEPALSHAQLNSHK